MVKNFFLTSSLNLVCLSLKPLLLPSSLSASGLATLFPTLFIRPYEATPKLTQLVVAFHLCVCSLPRPPSVCSLSPAAQFSRQVLSDALQLCSTCTVMPPARLLHWSMLINETIMGILSSKFLLINCETVSTLWNPLVLEQSVKIYKFFLFYCRCSLLLIMYPSQSVFSISSLK